MPPAGFALGALSGIIIDIITRNLAVWLAIGVGGGMVLGAAIGAMLQSHPSDSLVPYFRPEESHR